MNPEQRALQRDLLLARAALERVQLAEHLDVLANPLASGRLAGLVRLKGNADRGRSLLRLASTLLALARRQPVLMSAALSIAPRLTRARVLRWALLAGGVAYVAWSTWRSLPSEGDVAADEMSQIDPLGR